jgi:plastocyanin
VTLRSSLAPARSITSCAGAFVCALVVLACEKAPLVEQKDRTLELAGDTIDLPAGVDLHDVGIRTAEQYRDFEPRQVQAKPGDYLRFTTQDRRTHAIVFDVTQPQQRAFLESTRQLRSPPLVTIGASWVIALKDAPAGNYPFRCLVHQDAGQLTVSTGGAR